MAMQKISNLTKLQKVALGVGIPIGLLTLCCCGGIIFTFTPAGQSMIASENATATAQSITATHATATAAQYALLHPTATTAPKPTATPKPVATPKIKETPQATATENIGLTIATGADEKLGGIEDAFIAQWGQPNIDESALEPNFQRSCGDTGDAWCLSLEIMPGRSGLGYVDQVWINSSQDEQWSPQRAQAICEAYMPDDAQYEQKVSVANQNNFVGYDLVYRSATLASRFPNSAFQDVNQNSAPPGTFDIFYTYTSDGNSVDGCQIIVGSTQTHL